MILRRLSQSLKEQNWTAIWIEFILLVVGVFLGIQVANWNAAQQDKKREAEFIARLDRDFQKIDARLSDNISRWEDKATSPLRVLADVEAFQKTGRWQRSKTELLSDLNNTFNSRIPAPRSATYTELLSAGQLGLIRSTKLRDALLEYDAQYGYSMTAFDVLVKRVEPFMATIVAHLEFDQTKTISSMPTGSNPVELVWSNVDLEQLVADPNLKVALNMYASSSRNQLFVAKLQQTKALAVSTLLKSSVKNVGENKP